MDTPTSIFNDVIGPVMRGPSSSHCAAALRIGRVARDLMGGDIERVAVVFDERGALATTHETQGSDMGLCGGLLGWDADDERLPGAAAAIGEAGIDVAISVEDRGDPHPSTYHLALENAAERRALTAVSTGGGIIAVTAIDGVPLEMRGDYYETLFFTGGPCGDLADTLKRWPHADSVVAHDGPRGGIVRVRGARFADEATVAEIRAAHDRAAVRRIAPVLPVLSRADIRVPFSTCGEMLAALAGRDTTLAEAAVAYESARGGIGGAEVVARMAGIVKILRGSIERGIAGTRWDDRILGHQSGGFASALAAGRLPDAGVANRIILYVTALMEVKSAMGVIVAAPTAGSCAALPGACLAVADERGLGDGAAAEALLAAGLTGVFIANGAGFAAEESGCQAECGSAAGMAAAALATLAGGTAAQAVAAASTALQNSFGMTCDPVARRVEVPCLGKNVAAAMNALACANMALAGFDPVIPLDEVIAAMDAVGRSLPRELRCTGLGGLSVTKTAKELERRLAGGKGGAAD